MGTPATVTGEQAQRELNQWQKRMNAGRRVPHLTDLEKKFSRDNCVHIYNIGPWDHTTLDQGTLGSFFIPACPPNQRFVRGPVIDGISIELVVDDERKMKQFRDEGRAVAEDIIGIGKKRARVRSLIHKGCFVGIQVGPDAVPLEKELAAAKNLLRANMLGLFKIADDAWRIGPEAFKNAVGEAYHHIMAANWLERVDVEWMKSSNPTHAVKCPKCSVRTDPDTMMCATQGCGHIFDVARFVAYESEQKRRLDEAIAKAKK
jgi:hypothetical protein